VPALLDSRVCLITGGSRGLGLAIAQRFAAEGAVGVALDLAFPTPNPLPAGFAAMVGDVGEEAALQAAVKAVVDRHGRLDVVVANAGLVPPWRETEDLDMAEWDRVMAVNVRGVAATIKQATPVMKSTGGAIVAMASINSFLAHPRQMLYTASKHAVLGVVRAAARDLGRFGIRVNAVAPGPIATEGALGRLATSDEVAKAVLFLASDLASGITGELLPVDAGLA
jgi:NAD(P)-dependent dehydrogenase (short-subunit alcohol dehydrogenase family)